MKKNLETYSPEQTEQRLRMLMRGAFAGPPTPMKAIPKRNGESRAGADKKPKASIQRHQGR